MIDPRAQQQIRAQAFWDSVKAELPTANAWVLRYDPEMVHEDFRNKVLELIKLDGFIGEASFSPPDALDGWSFKAEVTHQLDAVIAQRLRKKLDLPMLNDEEILSASKGTLTRAFVELGVACERFVKVLPCPHVYVYRGGTGMMGDETLECLFCDSEVYPEGIGLLDEAYANLERLWKRIWK